jgi:hypothetical protein
MTIPWIHDHPISYVPDLFGIIIDGMMGWWRDGILCEQWSSNESDNLLWSLSFWWFYTMYIDLNYIQSV